jgi:hypothetical protein
MSNELLRAVVGLPVAVLWPLGVPALAERWWSRAAGAVAVALFVLATTLPAVEGWILTALVGALAACLRAPHAGAPAGPRVPPVHLGLALSAAVFAAAAAAIALEPSVAWETLRNAGRSSDIVFVAVGALAAVPATGALVNWLLSPFAARLAADEKLTPTGMLRAGLYIGWCERALVYAFLLGGEPGAAGLALTAKSVARFPTFSAGSEPLAEYVLIGTLLSFLLAVLAACGVRALLGLPVF